MERTFLVIDDEPDILDSIYRLFRKEYRVLRAQNTRDAWELIENEEVHVVLTDQRMPETTGVEFLTELRATHPDIVRVLLTGYSSLDSVIEAINEGSVYRYIAKPWNPLELKLFVSQAFDYFETRRERELLVEKLKEANAQLEEQNQALQDKNEELKLLDRMKSVFMEVVSHELNTPIAVILGYEFLLRRELTPATNVVIGKALAGIESSANRLKNISSRIFKMMATEDPSMTLDLQPTKASELGDALRLHVDPFLVRRHQMLRIDIPSPFPPLYVDREKIIDVLINVVMNAIKFSHDNQEIVLAFGKLDDSRYEVWVQDQGIGIEEEDLQQVFAPFFSSFNSQYHSSGEFEFGKRGIGLGLALARRFVEMHGGTIQMDSTPGEGTRVGIQLPFQPEKFDSSGEMNKL